MPYFYPIKYPDHQVLPKPPESPSTALLLAYPTWWSTYSFTAIKNCAVIELAVILLLALSKFVPAYPYFVGNKFKSQVIIDNLVLDQTFDFNGNNLIDIGYNVAVTELKLKEINKEQI